MDQRSSESARTWISGLAEFAHGFHLDDAPAGVSDQAKLCVLDTLGCIVSGAADEAVHRLAAAEKAIDPREEVLVPGLGQRFAPEAAARINAYMGDVFEWNDLVGGHASIACLPAALSIAIPRRLGGAELLDAFIAGAEVTAAMFEATSVAPSADSTRNYRKPYDEVSLGPVSVPSSVGAAATASKLLNLTAEQTEHALAASVVLAAYSAAEGVFGASGTIKPLLFGPWPAFIGMRSASYAAAGLTGALRVLESDTGFFKTVSYEGHPVPKAGGEFWRLRNPRRKYHANCGFMHSAIDALVELRRKGVDFAAAKEIRVAMPEDVKLLIGKDDLPKSPGDTMFHAEYNLALAAMEVDAFLPKHSLDYARYLNSPDFRRILEKIRTIGDPKLVHSICSAITVIGQDGQVMAELYYDAPKGSYANTMSREEVEDKFRQATAALLDREGATKFIERVRGLEQEVDCDWLTGSFH